MIAATKWKYFINPVDKTVPIISGKLIPKGSFEYCGHIEACYDATISDGFTPGFIVVSVSREDLGVGDMLEPYLPKRVPMIITSDQLHDVYEQDWFNDQTILASCLNSEMHKLTTIPKKKRHMPLKSIEAVIISVPKIGAMLKVPDKCAHMQPELYIMLSLREKWCEAAKSLYINGSKPGTCTLLVPQENPRSGTNYVGCATWDKDSPDCLVEFNNDIKGLIQEKNAIVKDRWRTVEVKLASRGCFVEDSDVFYYDCNIIQSSTSFRRVLTSTDFHVQEIKLINERPVAVDEIGMESMWEILLKAKADKFACRSNEIGAEERTTQLDTTNDGLTYTFMSNVPSDVVTKQHEVWMLRYDNVLKGVIVDTLAHAFGYESVRDRIDNPAFRFSCNIAKEQNPPVTSAPKVRFAPVTMSEIASQPLLGKPLIGFLPLSVNAASSMTLKTWSIPWGHLNANSKPVLKSVEVYSNRLYIIPAETVHQEIAPADMIYAIIYIRVDTKRSFFTIAGQPLTFKTPDGVPLSQICIG